MEQVRYTLVAVSLDVNTDSNTRQRDLCHTDAYITGIGQLALSSEYGVSQVTPSPLVTHFRARPPRGIVCSCMGALSADIATDDRRGRVPARFK